MKQSKQDKALDKAIETAYYRLGNGVQVNIFDIGKIFNECKTALKSGIELDVAVSNAISKYRKN